jgi:hypothetical protein
MNQFAPLQPQGIEEFTVEPTSEARDMARFRTKRCTYPSRKQFEALRRGIDRLRAECLTTFGNL